jgi:prepilin-type N-terminal cleavage/methylation domain-containing protein
MKTNRTEKGFSLVELIIAMTVMLVLLGLVSTILSGAISTRTRESRKTDALSSSQAALNVISREVANSGYGLSFNGLIAADSGSQKIRVRANLTNTNNCVTDSGEDVTYFYDATTRSIVRSERYATTECGTTLETKTSVVGNRISNITFQYWDYTATNTGGTVTTVPTANTGRVVITVEVELEDVEGQPSNQKVTLQSDVTLRNSEYMLNQY